MINSSYVVPEQYACVHVEFPPQSISLFLQIIRMCTTTFKVLPAIGQNRAYRLQVRVQVARYRFQNQAGRQDS